MTSKRSKYGHFIHVTPWGIEHADTEFDPDIVLMKITRAAWLPVGRVWGPSDVTPFLQI